MKNFTFTLLFLSALFLSANLFAQCPTGDVTLSTQAEVDQFVADYPNCEVIEGALKISGNDISDISGLSNITEIKGKMYIGSTPNLTSINLKNLTTAGLGFILSRTGATSASFENLKTVNGNGGPFYVSENMVLQNLNLPKLESTAGYFVITTNSDLLAINLPFFEAHGANDDSFLSITNNKSIQSVNLEKFEYFSDLTISGNINLASINLNNLRGTGGSPSVRGRVSITKNTNLSSLDLDQLVFSSHIYIEDTKLTSLNLEKLKSVDKGMLRLKNNTKLLQFDLSSLTSVSHISIIENSKLEQISTLENLTTVTGNLNITNNPNLTDCSGLCNILNNNGVTGTITIENNPSECSNQSEVVTACNAPQCPTGDVTLSTQAEVDQFVADYPNCDKIEGYLTIEGNTITDISGLAKITTLKRLYIINTSLSSVDMEKIKIGYRLIVTGNSLLTNVNLGKFDSSLFELRVNNNAKLTSIVFENLQECRIIKIKDNESLKKISLPNSVASGWGNHVYELRVNNNASLTSIYLPKIGYIKEDLDISDNPQLINLDISGIVRGGDSFRIFNNPELTSLTLNNAVALGDTVHDGGDITISDNQKLKSISCTKLENLVGRTKIVNNPNLEIINFKELKSTGRGVVFSPITIKNNPLLSTLDLSNFEYAEGLTIDNTGLKKIDLPELKVIFWRIKNSNFLIKNNTRLTSISFNKLSSAQDIVIENNILLSSLNLCKLKDAPRSYNPSKIHILQNPKLTNICLDALEAIEGSLQINHTNLTNLNTLQDLGTVGDLTISNNPNLTDCSGLCNVLNNNGASGTVTIENNPSACSSQSEVVTSCNAPQCPTGDVTLSTQAEVDQFVADYPNCDSLSNLKIEGSTITDLSGLSNLVTVAGRLYIKNTSASIISLENLKTVSARWFIISGNASEEINFPSLTSVIGFEINDNPQLKKINLKNLQSDGATDEGTIGISSNRVLKTINLENLKASSTLRITNNIDLESINLKNLLRINALPYIGVFQITGNPNLITLNLNSFYGAGRMFIEDTKLTSLDLHRATDFYKSIQIKNNSELKQLLLPNLKFTSNVTIEKNSTLEKVDFGKLHLSLSSNSGFTETVNITENPKLTELNACELIELKTINLSQNTSLNSICLDKLTTLKALQIKNTALTNLNTLQNLGTVGDLTISNNPNLTDCSGLCNVLNNNGVSGTVTIENNPSACSSQTEVETSCASLAIDDEVTSNFTVYPNPTQGILTLSTDLVDAKYTITDIMGRILKKDILKTNTIDISTFKSGMYYLSIAKGNDNLIKTIIKN